MTQRWIVILDRRRMNSMFIRSNSFSSPCPTRNYRRNIAVRRMRIPKNEIEWVSVGFFRQITSPNVIASQVKLTELLEILLKVRIHFRFDWMAILFDSSCPIISTASIHFILRTFQRVCKAVSIMYVTEEIQRDDRSIHF